VTAPSLTTGDPAQVTVGWTVTNLGTAPGSVATWTDSVIAAPDTDPSHGTVLATFIHQGLLQAGENYVRSETFLLPPAFSGHYHLFVQTDATKAVFENGSEANNAAEAANAFDVTPIPYADLVVSSLTAPSTGSSSHNLDISWTVTNQAPHAIGTTNTTSWTDSVYLASDPAGKNIVASLETIDHVGALAVGGSYTHSISERVPDGISGTLYVVVRTGGPYEFIYSDNNSAVSGPVAIALTPGADLTPSQAAITTPGSTALLTAANAGDKVDVTWTIRNVGNAETHGAWIDSLSLKEVGGTRQFVLGAFDNQIPLDAGKSITRTEQVQLPANVQGVFQLVLATNAGLFPIYEAGADDNNQLPDSDTITLTVLPNPDLQVFSIDNAPPSANAGGTVALAYTIINQGTVEARGHWSDNVYISLTDHIDSSAILLGSFENQAALLPGEKYQTITTNMPVSRRLGGPAYLIVVTNANGAVNEFPHGDNNLFVQPIHIVPEPPADLVTSGVTAPQQAFDGSTITVSYHVSNLGLEPTDQTNWTDTIWLTRDPTRPNVTKGDVLLATLPHTGVLGNDPSVITLPTGYDVTTAVTLPRHITGQFYITAWADSFDLVHKSTQDTNVNPDDPTQLNNDNYKARPTTILLTPPPDLVVQSVTPQASAVGGDDFTVEWTVQNKGTSPTEDDILFDQVYLSDKPTFVNPAGGADVGNQWYLGTVEHDGIVVSNSSYTTRHTFQLSPEISGRYVIVVTNTGGVVVNPDLDPKLVAEVGTIHPPTWEGPYTDDNLGVGDTHVTPLPLADLQVTSVVGQTPNYSGETAAVTWTVQNFGAAAWTGTRYWVDDVYFSAYPVLDFQKAIFEGEFPHSNDQPLGANASYTTSATFKLPKGIGGTAANPQTFYVYVVTDARGASSANSRANSGSRQYFTIRGYEDPTNNQGGGTLPVIYREPDLQVTNLVVPSTAPHSGDTIPITWTVTNVGNRDTREGYWRDRVYLSSDPSLDHEDTELGEIAHSEILTTGSQYSETLNVRLPDGIGGSFYILVFTDSDVSGRIGIPGVGGGGNGVGAVPEFQGEGNNITTAFLPVILAPPPDLQVTQAVAIGPDANQPGHVLTGQSITVNYTVVNNGSGDTPDRQSDWIDTIYMSRDQFLSDADVYVATVEHKGGLKAGASYQNSVTFKAPRNLTGPWYVFVRSDPPTPDSARGVVFEGDGEDNNVTPTATPLLIELPPPSDLVVTTVTIPASAMSGAPVHVAWTVMNVGVNPANGSWSDTAYLSGDAVWDISDRPIGRFLFSGTVVPGDSYNATLDASLPPATPGTYRIIVRSDIFDDITESDDLNNTTTSADFLQVTVPELQLGVPLAALLSTGEDQLYQVTVPQGQTLRVKITSPNPAAANELYLRYNALPSGTTHDAAYPGALQANQIAVVPSTTAGIYYVLVHGQSEPAANTAVTIEADLLPFEITDVLPDKGGDSRYVTTTILGAQFDPQAIVKLVRPGFAEYEPASYQVMDKTRIIAIFDLTNAPHGLYDVEVINPDGTRAVAPYRYLVEQALAPDISLALGGPRVVWAGNSGLYGFTLTSRTNVDIPYVQFQYGVPGLPLNELVPYLGFNTNVTGEPTVAGVPWASVTPSANTNGQLLTTGYAIDFADRSNTTFSFVVQTYPDGLPPGAYSEQPGVTAFAFNIMGAATPLTRDEYIVQQTQLAATLRTAILNDPTASSALQTLAADAASWTDLYLLALTQAGLLRPVDQPPEVHDNPVLVSLQATLAAGILAGPAGNQIITNGNLVDFFNQVRKWYGDDPGKTTPYTSILTDTVSPDDPTTYLSASPPPASDFDLHQSAPTHYEGFQVFVPWANDWDFPTHPDAGDSDETHPENPNFVNVQAPNFAPYFSPTARTGLATIAGPLAYGSQQFVPLGQPEPYTIQFQNAAGASSTVGEVRIVSQLDSSFDARTFRLGDLQLGNIQVHIPNSVGSFQGDFDFVKSKGFILRVSAGIDINSNTITWLCQAIDPLTGEVITDPTKGLLPPDNAQGAGRGFVSYTVAPKDNLATGTLVSAQARVLFNTAAPLQTSQLTYTIDGSAPVTTTTVTPVVAGGSDFQVQWSAHDENGGSGVKSVTVFVAEDGGTYKIWQSQTTDTSGIYNGRPGHTYQFLALATDNAGNQELPPIGTSVPDDASQSSLGSLPTATGSTPDLGAPPTPSPQPSTNPLFVQAQQGIPSAAPQTRLPEFKSVVAPFDAHAFATGIGQSSPEIGPLAILVLPDGSVLASGGAARNQLFRFTSEGGQAGAPLATLPEPIYDMALDPSGSAIWATTGGGPLYKLDPATGAVLDQFGDGLTQSLAIQPETGRIFVSSGNGIEVFDPTTGKFSHFSDIRVGSLGFAPDGTLWAATWPHNQTQIIRFTGTPPRAATDVRIRH
jgi:hypothetical protein